MGFFKKLRSIGPGILVTSAFIGPGTVTICTIAGYLYGFQLLWALVFSIIATIILQQMCARLGIITQSGLGEALKKSIRKKWLQVFAIILTFSAIIIGNGAYEAGNISGASLGLQTIFPYIAGEWLSLLIGGIALLFLLSGNNKVVEKLMIVLVLIMSIVFIVTSFYLAPDFLEILSGAFIPEIPDGSIIVVVGLIGTTVVPYNLFLHTSSSAKRWKNVDKLKEAKFDTNISILIGGIISMAIVITAASARTNVEISGAADLALQLEPLLGEWAKLFVALGLFAAGISSSITAPLAAAYAASGIFDFSSDLRNIKFKIVASVILIIGIISSILGFKPIEIIKFAQVANGILLPFLAIFLVYIVNQKSVMGDFTNKKSHNIGGILVILITLFLGIKSLLSAAELI